VRFDTVVFTDSASLAALSCFSRLKAERDLGRKTLLIALVDTTGADAIAARGLATVKPFEDVEGAGSSGQPWRERLAVTTNRLDPRHLMAPLGLLGAPQTGEYFKTLRLNLSVNPGRDLLFFEERPHCLVPESVPLRLAAMGVRLPPVSPLPAPSGYASFALRVVTGIGVPPIFGTLKERARLARQARALFREASDWDSQRALGPKLQPVIEPWRQGDSDDLFDLAKDLGQEGRLGSKEAFNRRMSRHAAAAKSPVPVERYWLSLPGSESDPVSGGY
jgi:hypothetical protein